MVQLDPGRALRALVVVVVCSSTLPAWPSWARALTLEEALERARERAPDVLRARARLADARGAVTSAEVPLRDDPVLEGTGGPRYTADGAWIPQLQVGVSQELELSGARDARLDAARARLDGAEAGSAIARREATLAVGDAFVGALGAAEAVALAGRARERAEALLDAGEARAAAGDLGAIEVRRLRLVAAEARAEEHRARSVLAATLARLRALLDLGPDEPLDVEGSLAAIVAAAPGPAGERPELRAVRAALREAEADRRIADAMAVPELGVGLAYQLEEGDHMGLVTLSLTLPIFDRGRGLREAAEARRDVLEAELDLRERAVAAEVAGARARLDAMIAALEESERGAADAAGLDAMLERSWQAGETSLTELLVVRAEVQGALRARLEMQREAGLARVALEAALGLGTDSDGGSR